MCTSMPLRRYDVSGTTDTGPEHRGFGEREMSPEELFAHLFGHRNAHGFYGGFYSTREGEEQGKGGQID